MEITHGKRPSKDRAVPISAGIPQMNRHFWPKRKHRDRFAQAWSRRKTWIALIFGQSG
jgi:hypothetical protein